MFLNLKKAIFEKPASNTVFNVKSEFFPPMIMNRTRISALATSIQHCIGDIVRVIRQEKRNERHLNFKERSKTISISGHDFGHRKSKKSTRKLLQLMKEFIKVSGYKINVQKSIVYTLAVNYTPSKLRKHLHLNAIKFTFAMKRNKTHRNKFNRRSNTCILKITKHC